MCEIKRFMPRIDNNKSEKDNSTCNYTRKHMNNKFRESTRMVENKSFK